MYNHNQIEKKWQKYWKENQTYKFVDTLSNPKFYVLDMFPYPSGKGLHVGHPKGYTATDVLSRYKRFNGFDVLHPIGWDAFGLPAEQYAIETNNHPKIFTEKNINVFRSQLQTLGFDYDQNKEVNTTDPKFYKWTQWIFTKLFEHGLAEIKEIDVNWCEALKTTLSNEEILTNKDGVLVSERGGYPVIKKPMEQWVLKITKYAEKLLDGLNYVDFPESLKQLQRNWIGKSVGHEFNFCIDQSKLKIKVFTTRIDTIYGVTAIVLSPKNPLTKKLVTNQFKKDYEEFMKLIQSTSDLQMKVSKSKNGFFSGTYAIHPLTNKKIPIWISDYVLDEVGTGAIMLVPAHDERDFDFASKYHLDIIKVIDENQKYINSDLINGICDQDQAKNIIAKKLKAIKKTKYKIRDWVFSRQRYWGEPFPIMFDENNKPFVINELPVLLPECNDFKPSDDGHSPLAKIDSFINIDYKGKKYRLDSNTMPQWAGSSWYYLAYLLKQPDGSYIDLNSSKAKEIFNRWLPVDIYIGGQEHAVLHLLYARFWHRFLYDIGIVTTKEPFYKIINQGMILGTDGAKMSKSANNGVDPNEIIESHGADALRLYECFMGPLTASLKWENKGLDDARKWLDRVYRYYFEINKKIVDDNELSNDLKFAMNNCIKNINHNLDNEQFNLAISDLMICMNAFYKSETISKQYLENFVIMLSCFAPHLAEEIFQKALNNDSSVVWQKWPIFNEKMMVMDTIKIPFQINGKLKCVLEIKNNINEEELINIIESNQDVIKHLKDKQIKKKIIVKNKIVNYLVE